MPAIAFSKKQVVSNAVALVAILAIAAVTSALTRPPSGKVRLYDAMFSERDLFAICEVLSEQGFSYETAEDHTILVDDAKLWAARAAVAEAGLPRDRLIRMPRVGACQVERIDGKPAAEREMTRQQRLEGELAFCLRQLPGVRGARVKTAIPNKGYFIPDPPQVTACVLLDLDPGHLLSKRTLQGMHHLLEGSVPELLLENITIVDTSGRDLTSLIYPLR